MVLLAKAIQSTICYNIISSSKSPPAKKNPQAKKKKKKPLSVNAQVYFSYITTAWR